MNKLTAKSLSLLMLLSLLGGKAEAGRQDDGYASESRDCCFSSCYECGCNPLYCGAWDLQLDGGVNPILWRQRDDALVVDCTASPSVVVDLGATSKFNNLFKTPWIVGGQIGYHWSDNARLYLEFNYSQTKGKNAAASSAAVVVAPANSVAFAFDKYKVFDAYVGARYYWDRWCDRVAFFLGAKVGLTHHKGNSATYTLTYATVPSVFATAAELYRSNTVVSGGANVGFDVCFCGNWSFVVTGEIVASAGPRAVPFVALSTGVPVPVGASNLLLGRVGSELRFPVTAGIRYSF